MRNVVLDFKTAKQRREFEELVAGDSRYSPLLLPLVLTTAATIFEVSGEVPVVTEILREANLYGYRSVHEYGRGVDFRSRTLRPVDIEEIVRRVCRTFVYRSLDGRLLAALALHTKGTGEHLHGQVPAAPAWRT